MIVSIREYPEDQTNTNTGGEGRVTVTGDDHDASSADSSVEPSTAALQSFNDEAQQNFHYEYIVDMTTVLNNNNATNKKTSKPVIFKRKGPALQTEEKQQWAWNRGRLAKIFVELFLPLGYPHSVDSSYLPYQLYDGLQGLCSYWRGVVATRAVLEAAGVGNAQATAASAAVQWALRDGTGMVGGLIFSYVASSHLDTHVKEFRLFADVINDVALTLDMLAPHVAGSSLEWSLGILCLSTIGKTLCGMSAGATKGRITQHFSRNGNMADLSAKESTQETLVSLLGMMGGVAVAHLSQSLPYAVTWILFGILTIVHVWANYKAVKLLKLATLNPERVVEVFKAVLPVLVEQKNDKELQNALTDLPTPVKIDESLASSTLTLLFPSIHLNGPIVPRYFEFANLFAKEKYIIGARGHQLFVYLGLGATSRDELTAYVHALLLQSTTSSTKIQPIDETMMKE